jgi:hypothetical protein
MKLDQDDGTYLVLDARVVKVEASDLMLDSAERHKGGGPFRRTLVHDQKDGLTINFAGDYPGGVTVAGPVHIAGPIDLVTDVTPAGDRLMVHGSISYEVSTSMGIDPRTGAEVPGLPLTVKLEEVIAGLQSQIHQLSAKVGTLEARLNK